MRKSVIPSPARDLQGVIPSVARDLQLAALCVLTITSLSQAQSYPTPAMDRARLAEIMGDSVTPPANPYVTDWIPLLRKVLGLPYAKLRVLEPTLQFVYNSDLPYSLNDGPLFAGRGRNSVISGGFGVEERYGPVTVRAAFAPTLLYGQNLPFQVLPSVTPGRRAYASPFYGPGVSADLPLRFGDDRVLEIDPGRSHLSVTYGDVDVSFTAENETWGPAIRNPLVMSGNAAGVPRLRIGARRPVATPFGNLSAEFIAGVLTESRFFDADTANDYRALSGLVVTLQTAWDTSLSIGLERVVYAPAKGALLGTMQHSLDVLWRWENLPRSGGRPKTSDQILGVFARWIFPAAGMEVYGELARMDLPRSLPDLITAWHNTGAFTFGMQWAQARRGTDRLRLQTEITYLEQSTVYPTRPAPDFYTGQAAEQGYTQRGQPIGAGIGPGGSSQWIAADYFSSRWRAGTFVGRVRWNNDAMYRGNAPNFFKHDVTLLGGARGAVNVWRTEWSFEATYAFRYNYLFQFGGVTPGGYGTVDARNLTVAIGVTPR